MAELHVIKQPGGMLVPANQSDVDTLQKVHNGTLLFGEFKQPRNPLFHRKYFALLNFAYDYWTPPALEYRGIKAEKNFERFRHELAVLAGHYTVTADLKGNVKLEPKSISFASMDETEFQKLYKATFDILWQYVLSKVRNMTQEVAHKTMEDLLRFD